MHTLMAEPFLDGLLFPECPRWHTGRLWLSDMCDGVVIAAGEDGETTRIVAVDGDPGGLGWLPDGRMLVVGMHTRRLHAWDGAELHEIADLSPYEPAASNDLTVDQQGRAYVSGFGFDLMAAGATPAPGRVLLVSPEGEVRIAADGLGFPNGMAIAPDGRTLIVAETLARCLTAFDIAPDGSLSNRRLYASTGKAVPDGIALDAEGGVWLGSPSSEEFLRVLPGGEVTHRIATMPGEWAVACALGGEDGRTLFLCTAETTLADRAQNRSRGRVLRTRVQTAGA